MIFATVLAGPAVAGRCDFVLRWDEETIGACLKELRAESSSFETRIQTMEAENRILTTHLCVLASESKTEAAASIAADTCAAVKARLAKKKKRP